jgi:hypothetical protein
MMSGGIGLGVDYAGNPVIDPTINVKEGMRAVERRQDDLRDMNTTWMLKWLDRELKHMDDMAILRESHYASRAESEAKRIDANRQFDMLGVNTAAERQIAVVATLAATTATSATNLATQTANTFTAVVDRIAALERTSYEGKGKEAVTDPAMAQLASDVRAVMLTAEARGGKSEGAALTWDRVIAILAIIGMFAALLLPKVIK